MNVQHITKARHGIVYPVLCQMTYGPNRTSCLIQKRAPEYCNAGRIEKDRLLYVMPGFDVDKWNHKYVNTTVYDWVVPGQYGWTILPDDNEEALQKLHTMETFL